MDTQVQGHETRRQFMARTGWRSDSDLFTGWRDDETFAQFRARTTARADASAQRLDEGEPVPTVTPANASQWGIAEEEPNAHAARQTMIARKTGGGAQEEPNAAAAQAALHARVKDAWKQPRKDRPGRP